MSSTRFHCEKYVQEKGSPSQQNKLRTSSVQLGCCIEKSKQCQRVLVNTFKKKRCVFGDIVHLQSPASGGIRRVAFCQTHLRPCPLPSSTSVEFEVWCSSCSSTQWSYKVMFQSVCCKLSTWCSRALRYRKHPELRQRACRSRTKVECAGPPCVMFSTSGLRKGKKDPRFEAHIVWLKFRVIRGEAIIIFENVPGYPVSELIKALGDSYTIFFAKLDPRQFGFGCARQRLYCLLLHKEKARWSCHLSFGNILEALHARPAMTAKDGALKPPSHL